MLALGLLLFSPPPTVQAQEDFFSTIEVDAARDSTANRDWSLLGWVIQKVGYGYQAPPPSFTRHREAISTVETSLYAQFDQRLGDSTQLRISGRAYHDEIYRLQDDMDFSRAETSEFRNRYEVRDLYVEHQTGNGLYIKFGNQILGWGMSEFLRVTDLVNTEDLYTFGQQDLEDLRLQVPALLGSVSLGDWTVDGVVSYRAGHDNLAPAGDEFDPFITLRQGGVRIGLQDPEREHEVFLRASARWSRGDIQLVAGEFNENRFSGTGIAFDEDNRIEQRFGQVRNRALGVAANRVSGPWLMFAELALHKDRSVRPSSQQLPLRTDGWQRKDQWLSALGLEYSGFRNLLVSLELDTIHTPDHDSAMQAERNQLSFGVRLYWTAMNERLQVLGVWNELADEAGHVGRLSLNYDWSDTLSAGLLWVSYDSPADSIFAPFRHNDIIQAQLRYNFQF